MSEIADADLPEQYRPGPIRAGSVEMWEEIARAEAKAGLRPGSVNWPMMVLSLAAEVRKLREKARGQISHRAF